MKKYFVKETKGRQKTFYKEMFLTAALAAILVHSPVKAETLVTTTKSTVTAPAVGVNANVGTVVTTKEVTKVVNEAAVPVAKGTVVTTTNVAPEPVPGVRTINFMSFDANKDNRLSAREVGDVLFKAFDTDGNGMIDNVEYGKASVMTVIPMKATTFTFYDIDSDGAAENTSITQSEFLERSNLMAFDKKKDGLSPKDFMGKEMNKVDIDNDNYLELDEWRREYAAKVSLLVNADRRYNK